MSPAIQVKERMQELLADRDHALAAIDKLLTVAETLQDKCEARERKLILTLAFLSMWLVFILVLPWTLESIPELKDTRVIAFVLVVGVGSFPWVLVLIGSICFRDWRRQSRDQAT